MRIRSANVPPSARKTHTATRYMIPIFLWSVLVSHEPRVAPDQ